MNKKIILKISVCFALITFLISCSKKKETINIGIINTNQNLVSVIDGLKKGMTEFGYIEGDNINYFYKGTVGVDEIEGTLKELLEKKINLILAVTTPSALKAKQATEGKNIPVVFAPVFSPVEAGLVKSLTHPGGHATGIQIGGSTTKALEYHKNIFPQVKNMFVPFKFNDDAAKQSLNGLQKGAEKFGINLIIKDVNTKDELKEALENIPQEADSIWLLNSNFLVPNIELFVNAALKRKLPLSSGTSQYNKGVLLSYGQDPFRTGIQASRLVQKILEGVSPADLPVETTNFFLGINLKTAREIGVKIPDDILQQADGIIR